MQETYLLISEVAKLLKVESHVLRYWEEELDLKIKRNEFGHRCYTRKDVQFLIQVKEWKEKGYPLKAIKSFLLNPSDNLIPMPVNLNRPEETFAREKTSPESKKPRSGTSLSPTESDTSRAGTSLSPTESDTSRPGTKCVPSEGAHAPLTPNQKMEQFQAILNRIVSNAIRENNAALGQEVSANVSERVLKEMDYLMRTQEDMLETHFKNLDQAIRKQQLEKAEKIKVAPKSKKERKNKKTAKSEHRLKAFSEVAATKE